MTKNDVIRRLVEALKDQAQMWIDTKESAHELQDIWMVDFSRQCIEQANKAIAAGEAELAKLEQESTLYGWVDEAGKFIKRTEDGNGITCTGKLTSLYTAPDYKGVDKQK